MMTIIALYNPDLKCMIEHTVFSTPDFDDILAKEMEYEARNPNAEANEAAYEDARHYLYETLWMQR